MTKTIAARFPGTCLSCRATVRKGETVIWEQGKGVTHVRCAHVDANPQRCRNCAARCAGPLPYCPKCIKAAHDFHLRIGPEIYYADGERPDGMTDAEVCRGLYEPLDWRQAKRLADIASREDEDEARAVRDYSAAMADWER